MNDKLQNLLGVDILSLVGLGDASPEIKESALSAAKNQILGAVVRRIHAQLSPQLREKFEQLFGAEDDVLTEQDIAFLQQQVPNLDVFIFEETLAFKKGAIDAVAEANQKSAGETEKLNGILNELKE